MSRHLRFLRNTLDAVPDHVVVIADNGAIQYANDAWVEFGDRNGCTVAAWEGLNYLDACERAAAEGDETASQALDAIASVLWDECSAAYIDYPCHSPTEYQWYRMVVTSFSDDDHRYGVILHRNITESAMAERSCAG
jgi:PAS domain-containing protein